MYPVVVLERLSDELLKHAKYTSIRWEPSLVLKETNLSTESIDRNRETTRKRKHELKDSSKPESPVTISNGQLETGPKMNNWGISIRKRKRKTQANQRQNNNGQWFTDENLAEEEFMVPSDAGYNLNGNIGPYQDSSCMDLYPGSFRGRWGRNYFHARGRGRGSDAYNSWENFGCLNGNYEPRRTRFQSRQRLASDHAFESYRSNYEPAYFNPQNPLSEPVVKRVNNKVRARGRRGNFNGQRARGRSRSRGKAKKSADTIHMVNGLTINPGKRTHSTPLSKKADEESKKREPTLAKASATSAVPSFAQLNTSLKSSPKPTKKVTASAHKSSCEPQPTRTSPALKDIATTVVEKECTTTVIEKECTTTVIEKKSTTTVIEKERITTVIEKDCTKDLAFANSVAPSSKIQNATVLANGDDNNKVESSLVKEHETYYTDKSNRSRPPSELPDGYPIRQGPSSSTYSYLEKVTEWKRQLPSENSPDNHCDSPEGYSRRLSDDTSMVTLEEVLCSDVECLETRSEDSVSTVPLVIDVEDSDSENSDIVYLGIDRAIIDLYTLMPLVGLKEGHFGKSHIYDRVQVSRVNSNTSTRTLVCMIISLHAVMDLYCMFFPLAALIRQQTLFTRPYEKQLSIPCLHTAKLIACIVRKHFCLTFSEFLSNPIPSRLEITGALRVLYEAKAENRRLRSLRASYVMIIPIGMLDDRNSNKGPHPAKEKGSIKEGTIADIELGSPRIEESLTDTKAVLSIPGQKRSGTKRRDVSERSIRNSSEKERSSDSKTKIKAKRVSETRHRSSISDNERKILNTKTSDIKVKCVTNQGEKRKEAKQSRTYDSSNVPIVKRINRTENVAIQNNVDIVGSIMQNMDKPPNMPKKNIAAKLPSSNPSVGLGKKDEDSARSKVHAIWNNSSMNPIPTYSSNQLSKLQEPFQYRPKVNDQNSNNIQIKCSIPIATDKSSDLVTNRTRKENRSLSSVKKISSAVERRIGTFDAALDNVTVIYEEEAREIKKRRAQQSSELKRSRRADTQTGFRRSSEPSKDSSEETLSTSTGKTKVQDGGKSHSTNVAGGSRSARISSGDENEEDKMKRCRKTLGAINNSASDIQHEYQSTEKQRIAQERLSSSRSELIEKKNRVTNRLKEQFNKCKQCNKNIEPNEQLCNKHNKSLGKRKQSGLNDLKSKARKLADNSNLVNRTKTKPDSKYEEGDHTPIAERRRSSNLERDESCSTEEDRKGRKKSSTKEESTASVTKQSERRNSTKQEESSDAFGISKKKRKPSCYSGRGARTKLDSSSESEDEIVSASPSLVTQLSKDETGQVKLTITKASKFVDIHKKPVSITFREASVENKKENPCINSEKCKQDPQSRPVTKSAAIMNSTKCAERDNIEDINKDMPRLCDLDLTQSNASTERQVYASAFQSSSPVPSGPMNSKNTHMNQTIEVGDENTSSLRIGDVFSIPSTEETSRLEQLRQDLAIHKEKLNEMVKGGSTKHAIGLQHTKVMSLCNYVKCLEEEEFKAKAAESTPEFVVSDESSGEEPEYPSSFEVLQQEIFLFLSSVKNDEAKLYTMPLDGLVEIHCKLMSQENAIKEYCKLNDLTKNSLINNYLVEAKDAIEIFKTSIKGIITSRKSGEACVSSDEPRIVKKEESSKSRPACMFSGQIAEEEKLMVKPLAPTESNCLQSIVTDTILNWESPSLVVPNAPSLQIGDKTKSTSPTAMNDNSQEQSMPLPSPVYNSQIRNDCSNNTNHSRICLTPNSTWKVPNNKQNVPQVDHGASHVLSNDRQLTVPTTPDHYSSVANYQTPETMMCQSVIKPRPPANTAAVQKAVSEVLEVSRASANVSLNTAVTVPTKSLPNQMMTPNYEAEKTTNHGHAMDPFAQVPRKASQNDNLSHQIIPVMPVQQNNKAVLQHQMVQQSGLEVNSRESVISLPSSVGLQTFPSPVLQNISNSSTATNPETRRPSIEVATPVLPSSFLLISANSNFQTPSLKKKELANHHTTLQVPSEISSRSTINSPKKALSALPTLKVTGLPQPANPRNIAQPDTNMCVNNATCTTNNPPSETDSTPLNHHQEALAEFVVQIMRSTGSVPNEKKENPMLDKAQAFQIAQAAWRNVAISKLLKSQSSNPFLSAQVNMPLAEKNDGRVPVSVQSQSNQVNSTVIQTSHASSHLHAVSRPDSTNLAPTNSLPVSMSNQKSQSNQQHTATSSSEQGTAQPSSSQYQVPQTQYPPPGSQHPGYQHPPPRYQQQQHAPPGYHHQHSNQIQLSPSHMACSSLLYYPATQISNQYHSTQCATTMNQPSSLPPGHSMLSNQPTVKNPAVSVASASEFNKISGQHQVSGNPMDLTTAQPNQPNPMLQQGTHFYRNVSTPVNRNFTSQVTLNQTIPNQVMVVKPLHQNARANSQLPTPSQGLSTQQLTNSASHQITQRPVSRLPINHQQGQPIPVLNNRPSRNCVGTLPPPRPRSLEEIMVANQAMPPPTSNSSAAMNSSSNKVHPPRRASIPPQNATNNQAMHAHFQGQHPHFQGHPHHQQFYGHQAQRPDQAYRQNSANSQQTTIVQQQVNITLKSPSLSALQTMDSSFQAPYNRVSTQEECMEFIKCLPNPCHGFSMQAFPQWHTPQPVRPLQPVLQPLPVLQLQPQPVQQPQPVLQPQPVPEPQPVLQTFRLCIVENCRNWAIRRCPRCHHWLYCSDLKCEKIFLNSEHHKVCPGRMSTTLPNKA